MAIGTYTLRPISDVQKQNIKGKDDSTTNLYTKIDDAVSYGASVDTFDGLNTLPLNSGNELPVIYEFGLANLPAGVVAFDEFIKSLGIYMNWAAHPDRDDTRMDVVPAIAGVTLPSRIYTLSGTTVAWNSNVVTYAPGDDSPTEAEVNAMNMRLTAPANNSGGFQDVNLNVAWLEVVVAKKPRFVSVS